MHRRPLHQKGRANIKRKRTQQDPTYGGRRGAMRRLETNTICMTIERDEGAVKNAAKKHFLPDSQCEDGGKRRKKTGGRRLEKG